MEQVLNQILSELKNVNQRLSSVEDTQVKTNQKLDSMEGTLDSMEGRLTSLEDAQVKTNEKVDSIAIDVKEINRKVSVIFDQTACLTEFTTFTKDSLKRIEDELNAVETVTAQNCFDITRLKCIK